MQERLAATARARDAWQAAPGGLSLCVRLTPKSARDALEGVEALADGRVVLKARVRAVPEAGKANTALINLVAARLDVAKSAVSLASGVTGRVKILLISGDSDRLSAALAAMVGAR